jgi:hypothetical protein
LPDEMVSERRCSWRGPVGPAPSQVDNNVDPRGRCQRLALDARIPMMARGDCASPQAGCTTASDLSHAPVVVYLLTSGRSPFTRC